MMADTDMVGEQHVLHQEHIEEAQQVETPPPTATNLGYQLGFRLPKPEKYSGARDPIIIDAWIHQVNEYLTLNHTPEDVKVRVAGAYLKDRAFQWFRRSSAEWITRTGMTFVPWDDFVKGLKDRFRKPNEEMKNWDDWDRVRQYNTVANYVQQFENLKGELDVPENIALEKFIRGLKPDIERRVRLEEPATIEDAIRKADAIDVLNYRLSSRTNRPFNHHTQYKGPNNNLRGQKGRPQSRPDTRPRVHYNSSPYQSNYSSFGSSSYAATPQYEDNRGTPMELDSVQVGNKTFSSSDSASKSTTTSNQKFMGNCFYCGNPGHKKSECRKYQKSVDKSKNTKTQ
jgi:Ty3 transposon capsid-like protein